MPASRAERAEVEGALARDKEEVCGLQRQMKNAGTDTEMLKLDTGKEGGSSSSRVCLLLRRSSLVLASCS
jgi:hypothetical protein